MRYIPNMLNASRQELGVATDGIMDYTITKVIKKVVVQWPVLCRIVHPPHNRHV
jgi:hypothetical protein